ncbi:hypothetical protein MNBD_GAMMA15-2236 [hydrothermal vent metagenome]|uniref:Uncharacterized protein n=1 Tax=hydrothermal vent metagenome TaxID=652676 RepID=A0A3B0XYZ4_9ZZZZ
MAKSAAAISEKITDMIRKQGNDYVTIAWNKFYDLTERDRIKDAFMTSLKKELKKRSFLMVAGSSVIIIAKDFNSHPIKD